MEKPDGIVGEPDTTEPAEPPPEEVRRMKGGVLRLTVQEDASNTTLTVHSLVRGQGVMSRFVRSTEGELRAVEQALQRSNGSLPPQIVKCSARWTFPDTGPPLVRVFITVRADGKTARGKGVHGSQTFAMVLAYEDACSELHRAPSGTEAEQEPILLPYPFSF